MAKPNYDFERRERDKAKRAKKEAKAREKAEAKPAAAGEVAQPDDTAVDPARPSD